MNSIYSILEVKEDSAGELYIEFPPELLKQVGWKEGDVIKWQEQTDKSFFLIKV